MHLVSNALACLPGCLGAPGAILHLAEIITQSFRELGEILTRLVTDFIESLSIYLYKIRPRISPKVYLTSRILFTLSPLIKKKFLLFAPCTLAVMKPFVSNAFDNLDKD